MPEIKSRIEIFCLRNDVRIPTGFDRHAASKFVAIRKTDSGWALTSQTWFNVSDLLHYLDTHCADTEYRIFDFEKQVELQRRGAKQVEPLVS